ncbi:MAG: hypothetical protein ACYTAN_02745 [Planctomycetota bacterium]|jgi:hypothetical protein
MSDDIREVMRPTPFSPLKRVGDRQGRGGTHGHAESPDREQAEGEGTFTRDEMETLAREVEAANERLRGAGRDVTLTLVEEGGAPLIEIALPSEAGGGHVTRRVTPLEFPQWVERLESGEGIIFDERV